VINSRGHIIVDFADVCTVMKNGGVAILGKAEVAGEDRAERAIEEALNSPLLNDNDIKGAKWILLNINSAEGDYECSMDELETINTILRARTGEHSDVIMGMGYDESLGDKLGITLIATGFEHKDPFKKEAVKEVEAPLEEKIMMTLQSEQLEQTPAIEPTDINAPNDLIAPELTEAAAVLDTVEITVDEIEIPMDEVEIPMDELAPTMQEFVMPEMSNVYVSAPDYDEEEEVIPAFEAIEASFEEEVISQEIVLEDFNASFEEEEVSEVFELNMEEEEAPSFTTEFVLNKPLNIYAEAELEATPEPSMPTNNEVIANTVVFESIEPIATEIAAETENVETSFRNVEMDTEEAPTMQLVMREESVGTQQNRPQHSNFDISLDNSEEQRRKVAERIQKLRNLSFNINNGSDPGVEFDAVPAYVRRNLDLFGNTMASVENYYSKYTVEQDEHNQTQISTINSFLDGKKPD
jgi:cell division protein FtsZ